MKNLVSRFSYLFVVVLFIQACSNEPKQLEISTEKITTEASEKVELLAENKSEVNMKVEGMVCAMGCAKFIEEKVADLDGIVLSQVNFEEGTAHFEFDNTALNSKEIEEFINGIHDGQYKAKVANNQQKDEELESADSEEESVSSVAERINISFPELFTYFLKRLR